MLARNIPLTVTSSLVVPEAVFWDPSSLLYISMTYLTQYFHPLHTYLLTMLNVLFSLDHNSETHFLQTDLHYLNIWSDTRDLLFKFVHIHFWHSTAENIPLYYINKNVIDQKDQHKDLGIIVTNNLSWSPHYNCIAIRINKMNIHIMA